MFHIICRKSTRIYLTIFCHIHAFRTHHSFCCSYVIARKGLDTAGVPMKKFSTGAESVRIMESPSTRQPFSPISLMVSLAKDANAVDDIQNKKLQKTLVVSNFPSITTTSKTTIVVDEENRTPMNTSMTPTPASVPYGEETEYSFEERRLGLC